MQITTILYFFAAAVYVGLGLRHWSRDRRDAAHRLFLGICLCFALWSFGYAMLTVSENLPARSCWRRVGYAGAVSYEVFILLFFLRHTGVLGFFRTRWFVDVSLWLIPAAFLYANIFHNAVHESFPDGFWYIGLHVMANTYNFTSIAVIALWMRRTPLKREKKQAGAIIVAGFVTIVVTLVCDFVMGLAGLPTLSPVLILIWIASISFAAKRYRFLGVTPKSISSEVLDQIGDFVAVSDTRGLLILASKRLIQRTSCELGAGFSALFSRPESVQTRVRQLESEGLEWAPARLSLRSPEGRIPVSGRFSRIRDDFGDPLGVLFVGCELVQIERIGTIYGLTCREKQIVDELATGNPNREIAEVLGISENTVKAHITNIYNKLCITNRIELLNLLEGFAVVPETVALPAAFTAERD